MWLEQRALLARVTCRALSWPAVIVHSTHPALELRAKGRFEGPKRRGRHWRGRVVGQLGRRVRTTAKKGAGKARWAHGEKRAVRSEGGGGQWAAGSIECRVSSVDEKWAGEKPGSREGEDEAQKRMGEGMLDSDGGERRGR